MAMSAPVAITVQDEGIGRCEGSVEAAFYYCCLEAVQNAVKHAGTGAHISIRLYADDGGLHVEVRDDGCGFDTVSTHDGVGLQNMRDRIGAVGGHIEITSHPGQGTRVLATAALARPSAAAPPGISDDAGSSGRAPADSVRSG
jgi:signal transduction histidine kinase